MALIEIKGLYKSFGTSEILNDINLDIEEGKVLALIGPTGSGKTTLLRLLDLLDQPTRDWQSAKMFRADRNQIFLFRQRDNFFIRFAFSIKLVKSFIFFSLEFVPIIRPVYLNQLFQSL